QVVAAHARLSGQARGDDDDVRARRVRVVVAAGYARVVTDDRRGFGHVQALALRQALHDVDQDDIGQPRFGDSLGSGGPDVTRSDDGDLVSTHANRSLLFHGGDPNILGLVRTLPGPPAPNLTCDRG